MKDIKSFMIKLIISIIVLAIAFFYLEEKPPVNIIKFDINQNKTSTTPSELKWYDPFKGIDNVPSK